MFRLRSVLWGSKFNLTYNLTSRLNTCSGRIVREQQNVSVTGKLTVRPQHSEAEARLNDI
jgi:hypothetical protein